MQKQTDVTSVLTYFGVDHNGKQFRCPCCSAAFQKTKIRADGGITCHKCGIPNSGSVYGTVVKLARVTGRGELEKPDVVKILREADGVAGSFSYKPVQVEPKTFSDPEVYQLLDDLADSRAAVKWWAAQHVPRWVVTRYKAKVISSPWQQVWDKLDSTFGLDRLVKSGLCKQLEDGRLWTVPGGVVGDGKNRSRPPLYPVMQCYRSSDGVPVGLEMRGNSWVADKAKEHSDWKKKSKKGLNPEGPKPKYIPKTRNLIGDVGRVGFGLDVVASVKPGKTVWLVEGFKDALAAASLGHPAVGLAGAGNPIPDEALEVLKPHTVAVVFDADEDGDRARKRLSEQLTEAGVVVRPGPRFPAGYDVADVLSARNS